MSKDFIFIDSPRDFRDSAATVVRIPRGISSKQKLFAVLADKLHFPRYFGWNWDALEECLGDLSWLPSDRPICMIHEDLPFGSGGENRQIYLDILGKLTTDSPNQGRILLAVFPAKLRDQISP
jgi:hypothetical protein